MKKQYNQPAVYSVEMMPQTTLCGSSYELNDPDGPVTQF